MIFFGTVQVFFWFESSLAYKCTSIFLKILQKVIAVLSTLSTFKHFMLKELKEKRLEGERRKKRVIQKSKYEHVVGFI